MEVYTITSRFGGKPVTVVGKDSEDAFAKMTRNSFGQSAEKYLHAVEVAESLADFTVVSKNSVTFYKLT